mgnify:CR=1 FL=1
MSELFHSETVFLLLTICALAVVTVISRGFFMIPAKPWPMPGWAQQALRVAPVAALAAVVGPEIFLTKGHLHATLMDARYPAVLAATIYYYFRRGILGTIIVGMVIFLPLRVFVGW